MRAAGRRGWCSASLVNTKGDEGIWTNWHQMAVFKLYCLAVITLGPANCYYIGSTDQPDIFLQLGDNCYHNDQHGWRTRKGGLTYKKLWIWLIKPYILRGEIKKGSKQDFFFFKARMMSIKLKLCLNKSQFLERLKNVA